MPREKKKETKEKKDTIEDVKETLKDEIHDYLENNIQKNMKNYIDETIKKELVEQIEKANKKVIKEKNKSILWKNIIIILLLGIIGFLCYLLYDNGYLSKYFVKEVPVEKEEKQEIIIDALEKQEPTKEELIEKYQYLIKDIRLSENSLYVNNFYEGTLTKEFKNYIAFNTLDLSKLEVEEDYNIVEENILKIAYEKIWSDSFEKTNFDYNGHKIRYFSKLKQFITDVVLENEETHINREIIDIKEENNKVSITTVEGLIIGDELRNVVSKEIIEDYEGESIINYKDQLNQVTYVFQNNKLESINV